MKNQRDVLRAGLTTEEYQTLVDELMKDRPNQDLIRKLMLKQGIAYTPDPISQMSLVLQSLSQMSLKTKDSIPV
jgi:hypothetical protein